MQHKFDIIIPPQDIDCEPGLQNKLANGEREAFAWVYTNYCKRIYTYAVLITNDEMLSEDITQEVFIKLWQHKEKIRNIENFNSYIYALTQNHIKNVLRKEKNEKQRALKYVGDLIYHSNNIEEFMNYQQVQWIVRDALREMPKKPRMVFELSKEKGMKNGEIEKVMGITSKTVRNQLSTALRFLRERIAEN